MGRFPDFLGMVVYLYIAFGFFGIIWSNPGTVRIVTLVPISVVCLGGAAILAFRTEIDAHDVWLFAVTTWLLFLVASVVTGTNTGPPQPVLSSVSWVVVALIAVFLVWGGGYRWVRNRMSTR